MSAIRVGVIGVGHLGYHHARLYNSLNGVSLVGIVDADWARGEEVAAEFGAASFASPEELLAAGVDAVSVAVPTSFHKEVALLLLRAGTDVLVEKPIAASTLEGSEMVEAATENECILQVGHVERFNGAVLALRGAVKEPRFIECHRLSPYPSRGHDVSVVHDLMIHDLDIILALVDSEVVSVDAVGVSVFSAVEDIANARVRFESGCVANLTSSRISVESMRKIRIFEDNAYVSTDYSAQEILIYRKQPGALPEGVSPMSAISIDAIDVKKEEPLKLELESFIQCVRDRGKPVVSGHDGLLALKLAERLVDFIRDCA
jgi:predicted dehydrogenase